MKPGAYPWRNHHNAWRPNHIHYSLFGQGFAQRLVTQMYFPGDPLLPLDPVFNAVADADAAVAMASRLAAFAAGCRATILNPPERIARTTRGSGLWP